MHSANNAVQTCLMSFFNNLLLAIILCPLSVAYLIYSVKDKHFAAISNGFLLKKY